jgi:lysophospholipase L1-like esterase
MRAFVLWAAVAAASAGPADAAWITTWGASPVSPMAAMGPFPATPSYQNRTFRQTLRVSAGGEAVRIRFTNAYGTQPLQIGAARVALLDARGAEIPGSSRPLGFAGSGKGTIGAGAALVSDSTALKVTPLSRLAVSLYLPGETGPCTCHTTGLDNTEISAPGNFVSAPFKAEQTTEARAFLASVEVDAKAPAQTVAVLGDSISDGVGSTSGANRRWPDRLAERLAARPGNGWAVANAGISGNRILNDGMGESALKRLDRDVLDLPGVKAMIVFEGVNDLGMAFGRFEGGQGQAMSGFRGNPVSADDIIDGYRRIVARAHARGVKVYGATIAPYKGATYWTEAGEAARQKINGFIRTGGVFDAVLDFDKVFQDPADPAGMRADFHIGDHLHGNDASYRAVGDSIDLSLFP